MKKTDGKMREALPMQRIIKNALFQRNKMNRSKKKGKRLTNNSLARQRLLRHYRWKPFWLPSHIWHAKRFHMCNYWGKKIALRPFRKQYEASYKNLISGLLLTDMSYNGIIEVTASVDVLKSGFENITKHTEELAMTSEVMMRGGRWGVSYLYHNQCLLVARLQYLWIQPSEQMKLRVGQQTARVWLISHPSTIKPVLHLLNSIFTSTAQSSSNTGPVLIRHRQELSSLRLVGPASTAALRDLLQPTATLSDKILPQTIQQKQVEMWKKMSHKDTPALFQTRTVLCLHCSPPQKCKTSISTDHEGDAGDGLVTTTTNCKQWNDMLRYLEGKDDSRMALMKFMTRKHVSHKLNRSLCQSVLWLDQGGKSEDVHYSNVPVVLLQQPGEYVGSKYYGSGWDLIVPTCHFKSLFHRLVTVSVSHNTIGLSILQDIQRDLGRELFPEECIESEPYKLYSEERKQDKSKHYQRVASKQRPNYHMLGVVSPFKIPWQQLSWQWQLKAGLPPADNTDYTVVRDVETLRQLISDVRLWCRMMRGDATVHTLSCVEDLCKSYPRSFVRCDLEYMRGAGVGLEGSMICIPTPDEMKKVEQTQRYMGPSQMRRRNILKSRRRKWKSMRNSGQISKALAHYRLKEEWKQCIDDYTAEATFECDVVEGPRGSDHPVIGYVTSGRQNHLTGKGGASGFISLLGFLHYLKEAASISPVGQHYPLPLLLLRDQHSLQYKFVKLILVVPNQNRYMATKLKRLKS